MTTRRTTARSSCSPTTRATRSRWRAAPRSTSSPTGSRPRSTRAREAAGDGDISIHGGATTVNQYLAAGLIDEIRLHIVPLMLGAGTRLFDGVPPLNLEQVEARATSSVTHLIYRVLS